MVILWLLVILGTLALGQTQVVLYSSGLSLVEETRRLPISTEGVLELRGFPEGTLWETLRVEGVEALALRPLPSEPWTLRRLLGQEVTVQTETAAFRGILREITEEGLVLETADGVVLVREYQWVRGPRYVPISKVQALLHYRAPAPGEKDLRFQYLTQGVSWKITYDAELVERTLDIFGKTVVRNDTGLDFLKAKITLIAGEIKTQTKEGVRALALAPEATPTEAFEYYRYDLPGTWDLPQGTVALPLVRASLPAIRFYRLSGTAVEVGVRFSAADQVFPAGEMRVYTEGILVGAGAIPHLPKGKSTELVLGSAFDLWGSREQVHQEKVGENLFRSTWRITLRSAKAEEVKVEVIETLPGYWRILSATLPYELLDVQRAKFIVPVLPGKENSLEYTVEWRY